MDWRDGFEIADFGDEPAGVVGFAGGSHVFNQITLDWQEPIDWPSKNTRPGWPEHENLRRFGLYAVLRDHPNAGQRNRIAYVGMARSLYARLYTPLHPTVAKLVQMGGPTRLSYALVGGGGAHKQQRLQEVEDILIWTFWPTIENKAGLTTLPSMRPTSGKGSKRSRPWIITNTGYDFERQMPATIVYPWILISKARVSSLKSGPPR